MYPGGSYQRPQVYGVGIESAGVEGRDEGVGVVGEAVGAVGIHVDYDDVEAGGEVKLHGVDKGICRAADARTPPLIDHFQRVGVGLGAGLYFDKHHLVAFECNYVELAETVHTPVALMDGISVDKQIVGCYRLALGSDLIMNGHGRADF